MYKNIQESISERACDRNGCTDTIRSGTPAYHELRTCTIRYKGYEAQLDLCQKHYEEIISMFPHCESSPKCYNPFSVTTEGGSKFCNECYNKVISNEG